MVAPNSIPVNNLQRHIKDGGALLQKTVLDVMEAGIFLNGPVVNALEFRFKQFLKIDYAVGVSNGSDALYLALAALGLTAGDTVVTVANAAGYGTSAIRRCGASPILIEIDDATAQISSDHLQKLLCSSRSLKAVILTHLYGLIGEVESIAEICREYGVPLIEDCAQSFGACFRGVPAGAWGDAAAFSFYPTKNLAALGDGGMVAFRDSEACARARKIAQYGWSSRYEVELPDGINSRLDEIQAAVVLHRLGSVDSRNSRRRDILRRYAEAVTMPRRFIFDDSERCVAHLAVMRTPTRDRDRKILNNHGIDTAIHYPIPDHHQPAWQHLFGGVSLPNTEAHCREVLTLPCFPELTEEEILRVCEALKSL